MSQFSGCGGGSGRSGIKRGGESFVKCELDYLEARSDVNQVVEVTEGRNLQMGVGRSCFGPSRHFITEFKSQEVTTSFANRIR